MARTTPPIRTVLHRLPLLAVLLAGPALAGDITISPADNLQAAINTASTGDTIHLMPGNYNQVAVISGKSITIEGISGSAATILSAAALHDTVLRIDNAPDPGVTIRGLTIRDGQTPGVAGTPDGYPNDGAGISANNSDLTVDRCLFVANAAGDDGGAIYSLGGATTTITNSAFQSNTAGPVGGGGGGVLVRGPFYIGYCTFTQNSAASGGAVYLGPGSTGEVDSVIFDQNQARNDLNTSGVGGAVRLASPSGGVQLLYCQFNHNSAASQGGAVSSTDAPALGIQSCGFTENVVTPVASGDGGGVYSDTPLTVTGSTFTRNVCLDNGGAIYVTDPGTADVERSRFLGNAALRGGGLRSDDTSVVLDCSFVGNQALGGGFGGALYAGNDATETFTISNSSFAGNRGSEPALGGSGATVVINSIVFGNAPADIATRHGFTYCDVEQSSGVRSGQGNINVPPLFTAAPGPGPDAAWGTPDDDYGDLSLIEGSPCIDAGNSRFALNNDAPIDLAGNDRNVDDPATPNTGVPAWALNIDMGAYEFQPAPPQPACPADFNNSGAVSVQDIFDFLAAYFAGCP